MKCIYDYAHTHHIKKYLICRYLCMVFVQLNTRFEINGYFQGNDKTYKFRDTWGMITCGLKKQEYKICLNAAKNKDRQKCDHIKIGIDRIKITNKTTHGIYENPKSIWMII